MKLRDFKQDIGDWEVCDVVSATAVVFIVVGFGLPMVIAAWVTLIRFIGE